MSLPHGPAVDKVLDELLPLLSPGDIVIDGEYLRFVRMRVPN
jgi:6-phosphogluconate dehydrogenase (decarboxylating)